MQKNVPLIVIVVLVVIGAIVLSVQRSSTNTASPSASSSPTTSAVTPTGQYLVTYGDQGFSPSRLTVPLGATVQFHNASSASVWVASNPHPTHTDYPGFDALREYASGETYSFTFTKVGSWGYHNHLNPSQGGTVVVQ